MFAAQFLSVGVDAKSNVATFRLNEFGRYLVENWQFLVDFFHCDLSLNVIEKYLKLNIVK